MRSCALHCARRPGPIGLALALALCLSRCGESSAPLLVLSVSGVPDGTTTLEVRVMLDGRPAAEPVTVSGRLDRFSLALPDGARGALVLDIDALQAAGCSTAAGHADASVTGDAILELAVPLTALPAPLCTLSVSSTGDGTIVSDPDGPAGIECGARCTARVPLNSQVHLSAQPGPASYLGDLRGPFGKDGKPIQAPGTPCTGTGSCTITVSAPLSVSAHFVARSCVAGHLCWIDALPQGLTLRRTFVRTAQDAWAVGDAGTILRFDGAAWEGWRSGTSAGLSGVWASGPADAWAVGRAGILLHFDGTAWAPVKVATDRDLNGVWGSGAGDVWIVGDSFAAHFDGAAWTPSTGSGDLRAVWGSGPGNVFAVGKGVIQRWTGSRWTVFDRGVPRQAIFHDVFGAGSGVWIVGAGGVILSFDGESLWNSVSDPTVTKDLYAIWGSGPDDVWIAGQGGTLMPLGGKPIAVSAPDLFGLSGAPGGGPMLAVGAGGAILARQGDAWPAQNSKAQSPPSHGWAAGPTDLFGVDGVSLERWAAGKWSAIWSRGAGLAVNALWGSSASDVWIAAEAGHAEANVIFHWNGSGVSGAQVASPGVNLLAIHGAGSTMGAVGYWPKTESPAGGAVMYVYDGSSWRQVFTEPSDPTGQLFAVWVSGPQGVWGVGKGGRVVTYDGQKATRAGTCTTSDLLGIWGSGPADVWAVGAAGAICHYDGAAWSAVMSGVTDDLAGIISTGPGDIWIAGRTGTLLHGDGRTWQVVNLGIGLYGFYPGAAGVPFWLASSNGLLRYTP